MQDVIVTALLVGALSYLGYRAYRSYHKKKCGDGDCGCK